MSLAAFLCTPKSSCAIGNMNCQYAYYSKTNLYASTCWGVAQAITSINYQGSAMLCKTPSNYFIRKDLASGKILVGTNDCNAVNPTQNYLCAVDCDSQYSISYSCRLGTYTPYPYSKNSSSCWYGAEIVNYISTTGNSMTCASPTATKSNYSVVKAAYANSYYLALEKCSPAPAIINVTLMYSYLCEIDSCSEKAYYSRKAYDCRWSSYELTSYTTLQASCWPDSPLILNVNSMPGPTEKCYVRFTSTNLYYNTNSSARVLATPTCESQYNSLDNTALLWFGMGLVAIYVVLLITALYQTCSQRKRFNVSSTNLSHKYKKYKNSLLVLYPPVMFSFFNSVRSTFVYEKMNRDAFFVSYFIALLNGFTVIIVLLFLAVRLSGRTPPGNVLVSKKLLFDLLNDTASTVTIFYLVPLTRCYIHAYADDDYQERVGPVCSSGTQVLLLIAVTLAVLKLLSFAVLTFLGWTHRFQYYVSTLAFGILVVLSFPLYLVVELPYYHCCSPWKKSDVGKDGNYNIVNQDNGANSVASGQQKSRSSLSIYKIDTGLSDVEQEGLELPSVAAETARSTNSATSEVGSDSVGNSELGSERGVEREGSTRRPSSPRRRRSTVRADGSVAVFEVVEIQKCSLFRILVPIGEAFDFLRAKIRSAHEDWEEKYEADSDYIELFLL